ncbi:phospholipase D-like domain-containing protein, partial [Klebsiella pneumoniae subsp. pneumoniae]|uniref:phospholipase D-like domain-containing protein n=1 Tax=Klebsiella pneumoniae TaxID=573 RepID=UPI00237DA30F
MNRTLRRYCLSGLISLSLFAPVPAVYAASIETGYSPEGTALQLVLKTINSAQQEIRLMGYSFTSPEVAGALVRAKQRGLDVKVVLDWKGVVSENGIYGHSRFCNTDFDDKLACLNLSG